MKHLRAGILRLSVAMAGLAAGLGVCGQASAQALGQVSGQASGQTPILAGSSPQANATPQGQVVDGVKVWELHPRPPQSPFPLDGRGRNLQALEFRTPEQMTQADALVAEGAQTAIAERALRQGFHIEGNVGRGADDWGYEQAVCPVFPDHLILEYSRDGGHGDISLFSAVVPRGGVGHVRVIPIRRRSYSLWTPTPTNALTLNDFNHMVKENPNGLDPDWLTIGLCYAALAGGHVRAALVASTPAEEVYPMYLPAKLTVFSKTGAEVHFADITPYTAPRAKAMDWVLNFAQNGRLLKVRHVVSYRINERELPPTPEQQSRPAEPVIDLSKPTP